jgi:hypothetical protein
MDDLSQVKCRDVDTGLEVTVSERFIQVLSTIDPRLEALQKDNFFPAIMAKATDKA